MLDLAGAPRSPGARRRSHVNSLTLSTHTLLIVAQAHRGLPAPCSTSHERPPPGDPPCLTVRPHAHTWTPLVSRASLSLSLVLLSPSLPLPPCVRLSLSPLPPSLPSRVRLSLSLRLSLCLSLSVSLSLCLFLSLSLCLSLPFDCHHPVRPRYNIREAHMLGLPRVWCQAISLPPHELIRRQLAGKLGGWVIL